tara:strand:- start:445 stop:1272 length:828 start_codon:yes stop_codon:yes gene_type:complete
MSLKLFYFTTEISPFANTSNLSKYSVDVPLALQEAGHDIRTILPKYGFVSERKYILREVIRLREIPFNFNGEDETVSAKSAFIPKTRVQVYFLENKDLFKPLSDLLYKAKNGRVLADNDERYAYFSMASIATLPHLFWKPDVIICNDWQTASVPLIYQQIYKTKEFYDNIKTVLTVHNFDEHCTYDRTVYDKLGVKIPTKIKGDKINCYEASAEDVDLIISLDSPSTNNTKKLLSLPLIKQNKKKLISIKVEDGETPNYETTSSMINEELSKHFA